MSTTSQHAMNAAKKLNLWCAGNLSATERIAADIIQEHAIDPALAEIKEEVRQARREWIGGDADHLPLGKAIEWVRDREREDALAEKEAECTEWHNTVKSVDRMLCACAQDGVVEVLGSHSEMIYRMAESIRAKEAAIKDLRAGLQKAWEDVNWMTNNHQLLNRHVFQYLDDLLAKYKEPAP